MKCLCGFSQLPNNGPLLKIHVESCMVDGACKDLGKAPSIVWRDGEFVVVRAPEEGEQTYDIGVTEPKSLEEEIIESISTYEEEVVEEETPVEE